jgi:F0F1-type ATP synthase assembly protein I
MPKKEEDRLRKNKERLNNYAKYSGIVFQMLVIIGLGVYGGIKLDEWLHTKFPVFTVVLSFLSVILAIYYVIKEFINFK